MLSWYVNGRNIGGVMDMGNIAPRTGLEHTLFPPFRANKLTSTPPRLPDFIILSRRACLSMWLLDRSQYLLIPLELKVF